VACVPAVGCYPVVFTDRNAVVSVIVEWVTDPPVMVYVINAVNESSVYNITLLTSISNRFRLNCSWITMACLCYNLSIDSDLSDPKGGGHNRSMELMDHQVQ